MPLGSLLGLFEAVLGGLGPNNIEKLKFLFRFLRMQVFGSLKLLMALLVPSWLLVTHLPFVHI